MRRTIVSQIVVFLLPLVLIGCRDKEEIVEKFSNGKLKFKIAMEAGLKNGEALIYDSVGNLREKGNYVSDTLEGEYVTYYEAGGVRTFTHYRKGRKEGDYFSYFLNGNIAQSGRYRGDYRRGIWYNYDQLDSGKIILENYVLHIHNDIDEGGSLLCKGIVR